MVCERSWLPGAAGGQGVMAVEDHIGQVVVNEVAAVRSVLAADVVVDAADPLDRRGCWRDSRNRYSPARSRGDREVRGCQFQPGGIKRGNGNLVVGIGMPLRVFQCSGRGQAAAVGFGAIHHAEVALQRRRGGVVGRVGRRVAALPGALIAAEEEQLVLDDAAARGAAELVALQESRSGCDTASPFGAPLRSPLRKKLEKIAVEGVGCPTWSRC